MLRKRSTQNSLTLTAPSGTKAIQLQQGAYLDLGDGSNDYLRSGAGNYIYVGSGSSGGLVAGELVCGVLVRNNSGIPFRFHGYEANGATAKAFWLTTENTLSTSGAKLLSIENGGVEKFAVDKDGGVTFLGGITGSSYNFLVNGAGVQVGGAVYMVGANPLLLKGGSSFTDAAGTVFVATDGYVTLTAAGAKLHSFRNNGTEKAFVDKDGNVETPIVGSGFILKSPDGTRYKIAVANGGALSASAA